MKIGLSQLTSPGTEPEKDTVEGTFVYGSDAAVRLSSLVSGVWVGNLFGTEAPTPIPLEQALAGSPDSIALELEFSTGLRLRLWESDGSLHQDDLYGFSAPPGYAGFATFGRFPAQPGLLVQIDGAGAVHSSFCDQNGVTVPRFAPVHDAQTLTGLFGSSPAIVAIAGQPPDMPQAVANNLGMAIDSGSQRLQDTSDATRYLVVEGIRHRFEAGAFEYGGFDASAGQPASPGQLSQHYPGPDIVWTDPSLG